MESGSGCALNSNNSFFSSRLIQIHLRFSHSLSCPRAGMHNLPSASSTCRMGHVKDAVSPANYRILTVWGKDGELEGVELRGDLALPLCQQSHRRQVVTPRQHQGTEQQVIWIEVLLQEWRLELSPVPSNESGCLQALLWMLGPPHRWFGGRKSFSYFLLKKKCRFSKLHQALWGWQQGFTVIYSHRVVLCYSQHKNGILKQNLNNIFCKMQTRILDLTLTKHKFT